MKQLLRFFVLMVLTAIVVPVAAQQEAVELPGLHNVRQAGGNVWLGSEPKDDSAFAALQKRGIKVIVSVDGAVPNVEAARKFGIRYIHIPIGYDSIPADATLALSRVARDVSSPVYVHCHHGRHRGPAAAAIVCIAAGSLNHAEAVRMMTRAGTGKDYSGLWRDVKEFAPPGRDVTLPDLKEIAEVEPFATSMARLDRSFEKLRTVSKANWKTSGDNSDIQPVTEALLVHEGLKENLRHLNPSFGEEFRMWLNESVQESHNLTESLRSNDNAAATTHMQNLEQQCARCHASYRN